MQRHHTASGTLATLIACAVLTPAAAGQDTLFAVSSPTSAQLWSIDTAAGDEDFVGPVTGVEAIFSGMAFDSDGDLYTIDGFNDGISDRLFLIDEATGDGDVVGDTGENWNFRSVAYDASSDTLYAARDNQLFTADRATGRVTLVASIAGPGLDQLTGFAIDASGTAYGSDIGDATIFEIDLTTGQATRIGDAFPGTRDWFNDLAVAPDGTLWGAREQGGGLFTIDTATGEATLRFGSRSYRSIAFEVAALPCFADFDDDGQLDIFDFLAFQNAFDAGDLAADCDDDGELTIFDFLCFQNAFDVGCG